MPRWLCLHFGYDSTNDCAVHYGARQLLRGHAKSVILLIFSVLFTADRVENALIHWCRVTHICVSKLTTFGSDNGLSPGRHQAIIWTNAGMILGTNCSEILSKIHALSFKKRRLKMSPVKCLRPQCVNPQWTHLPSYGFRRPATITRLRLLSPRACFCKTYSTTQELCAQGGVSKTHMSS